MQLALHVLAPAQRRLWPLLKDIPQVFVLYGGTAIALQLGHRISIDFDFFSDLPLNKEHLIQQFPLLKRYKLVQPELNTLHSVVTFPEGPVNIQFLANLGDKQKRVAKSIIAKDNQIQIASLKDLLATKLNTIQHRAMCKDYIDIDAMIRSGLTLEAGLGCAIAVFGQCFDPATSLRALCSYRDGDLNELDQEIKEHLSLKAINVDNIPQVFPYQAV